MDVRVLEDPAAFAEQAEAWLCSEPFSTNVIGVHLQSVLSGVRARGDEDLWLIAFDGAVVMGAAMHTPPHHVFLPRLRPGIAEAFAAALWERDRHLTGANGEQQAVAAFAGEWVRLTGARAAVERRTRLYRLVELRAPSAVGGVARAASDSEPGDRELVRDWFVRFQDETGSDRGGSDVASLADRRLEAGELWCWRLEGRPVSLAGLSAPSAGVARVGPVYTPPERRKQGYAAALTAALSELALGSGAAHVVLYTDLANPTSNGVYQRIGYVVDHDGIEMGLLARARHGGGAPLAGAPG